MMACTRLPSAPTPRAAPPTIAHRYHCLEAVIGTRYTVDTIIHLRRRVSGVHFVWIMGADNLAQFHRWKDCGASLGCADCRDATDRPRVSAPLPHRRRRRSRAIVCPKIGDPAGRSAGPGLGLSHRHEIQSVFDRPSEPGWELRTP